jgi:hypothetical protein
MAPPLLVRPALPRKKRRRIKRKRSRLVLQRQPQAVPRMRAWYDAVRPLRCLRTLF